MIYFGFGYSFLRFPDLEKVLDPTGSGSDPSYHKEESTICYHFKEHSTVFSLQLSQNRIKMLNIYLILVGHRFGVLNHILILNVVETCWKI